MSAKGIKKVVLLPDIHYPEHDNKSLEAIKMFLIDFKPDFLVYQGDQLDMGVISHWNQDKKRQVELKRLKKDYDGFNDEVLTPFENIVGKKCKKKWITGNHEDWAKQYIDKNPQLEGIIEPEICLNLEKRGYEIIPLNGVLKLGKLSVIHGFYWNQYHSAKHAGAFNGSVVYCHTHTVQEFMKTSPVDSDDFRTATCLPCLCNLSPEYTKGRPNSWVHGFGIVYLYPNGNFNLYRVLIINNQFIFNNTIYGPNKKTRM